MSTGVQSVSRALDLLELVAAAGGAAGLSELATRSGLPLSTVHRITRSLVGGGYLAQDADRRYRLGLRLVPLGAVAHGALQPWTSRLSALVAATGETANAATLAGDVVVLVAREVSPYAMRSAGEVGRRAPLHASAAGKALLALLTDEAAAAALRRALGTTLGTTLGTPGALPALTPRTLTSVEAVLEEVRGVRTRGYAVDDEEEETGARCVAVPVPDAVVPLALSLSGPTARITRKRVPELAAALRLAARRLP